MRKERTKRPTRKVDRLLRRHAGETARGSAREFDWTQSIESPARDRTADKSTLRPRLPRTRE
jgi:hypothetical protein